MTVPRSGERVGYCAPGESFVSWSPTMPVVVSIWKRLSLPSTFRVLSRMSLASGVECGTPGTGPGGVLDVELAVAGLAVADVLVLLAAVELLATDEVLLGALVAGVDRAVADSAMLPDGAAVPEMPLAHDTSTAATAARPATREARPWVIPALCPDHDRKATNFGVPNEWAGPATTGGGSTIAGLNELSSICASCEQRQRTNSTAPPGRQNRQQVRLTGRLRQCSYPSCLLNPSPLGS